MPVTDHEVVLVPQDKYLAVDYLIKIWESVGRPTEPFSKSGLRVVEAIIEVWKVILPEEYVEWKKIRDDYQRSEKDIHTQVREGTGRISVSMPRLFVTLIHKMFPDYKMDKSFFVKLAKHFEIFRFANKI